MENTIDKIKILKSITSVTAVIRKAKLNNLKIGLITGAFDVLHMGHIDLFRFAKKHSDLLIVGLDHDDTLKTTKGKSRPINNYARRSAFLSEISLIDNIFKLDKVFKYGDETSYIYFKKLYKRLKPTFIFSHVKSDLLYVSKKQIAKETGCTLIAHRSKQITNSTTIIKKLELEF